MCRTGAGCGRIPLDGCLPHNPLACSGYGMFLAVNPGRAGTTWKHFLIFKKSTKVLSIPHFLIFKGKRYEGTFCIFLFEGRPCSPTTLSKITRRGRNPQNSKEQAVPRPSEAPQTPEIPVTTP